MTYHARLNLIMLITILGVLVFLYFKPQTQEAQQYLISSHSAQAVQNLRVLKQQNELVLSQTNNQWYLIKPIQARADEKKIREILQVRMAKSQQRFPLENLDRFGLKRPFVQLYIDDEYFGFGGFSPITNQQYIAKDDYVYMISPRYGLTLPASINDLISLQLLESDEIPIRFELDHIVIEFQNKHWSVRKQQSKEVLGEKAIMQWVLLWQTMRTEKMLPQPEIISDFVEAGNIAITLRDDRKINLNVLQNADQILLIRLDEGVGYTFPIEVGRQLLDPLRSN